jgi:hypothetical protein
MKYLKIFEDFSEDKEITFNLPDGLYCTGTLDEEGMIESDLENDYVLYSEESLSKIFEPFKSAGLSVVKKQPWGNETADIEFRGMVSQQGLDRPGFFKISADALNQAIKSGKVSLTIDGEYCDIKIKI